MADTEIEGVIERLALGTRGILLDGVWYTADERSWKFVPDVGTRVKLAYHAEKDEKGRDTLRVTFVEKVRSAQDAKDAFLGKPVPEGSSVQEVLRYSSTVPAPFVPLVRKEFMKECLIASVELWGELSKTEQFNAMASRKVLDQMLAAGVVATAHSMFIDGTKEGRTPVRR